MVVQCLVPNFSQTAGSGHGKACRITDLVFIKSGALQHSGDSEHQVEDARNVTTKASTKQWR